METSGKFSWCWKIIFPKPRLVSAAIKSCRVRSPNLRHLVAHLCPGESPSEHDPGAAEVVATAMLLAAVVGSGIMAERLAGGNVAIALLANTIATGAALVTLILTFGPV